MLLLTSTVPSFKSFQSGVFVLSIHTHTYIHTYRDKVTAISALPYVVGADKKIAFETHGTLCGYDKSILSDYQ